MKKLALLIALLLIGATLLESISIVKANPSPTIEWKGWSIGSYHETVGFVGDTISANVRMSEESSGHYRIRIMRDIWLGSDEEMTKLEFDYDSSDRTYSLSFTPTIGTNEQDTEGYHVDIYKKELWGALWVEKWTMQNEYPPRLRVIGWSAYHSYGEIESGLRSLERGIAKVQSIGASVQGRQIWAIKISDDPNTDDENEPDVLFVGLHHAREWISAEVPLYLAARLVQAYQTDSNVKMLVDNSEIWIVPVQNPDGLEYSRLGGLDSESDLGLKRLWRKNRQDNGDGTHGVDANRNYGYEWGGSGGSSTTTSDGDYRGPGAFSEPETRAIRDFILDSKRSFEAVLSYHSFSELILYPWGYTGEDPEDIGTLNALGVEMSDLINSVHGSDYRCWQAFDLYQTRGDLTDWVYGAYRNKNGKRIPAFTIELRPYCATPPFGPPWDFVLTEDQILDTCEENIPASSYLVRWAVLSQGGFMDFEAGVDDVAIRSTIPGMKFTTTMGYDWVYGDIRTGKYNVNPYNSRDYECLGNIFAWLGPNQGSGRIDFTGATAESIGMLTSTATGTYLDAYDSSGTLLATSFARGNTQTGTMSEVRVATSNIAYVIVHDTGNYWLIDDLRVSDLLRETNAFQSQDSSSMFQTLDLIDSGASSIYEFTNSQLQSLNVLLNWKGSKLGIQVSGPDGTVVAETESENPPIRIVVPEAEPGTWKIVVTALDVPYNDYPFALDVASVPLPSDTEHPATTLEMGSPKFTDSSDNIYVTSSTPFTLTAEDNIGGTGVASTQYRIYNTTTYDTGLITSTPPIEFHLTGIDEGEYSIDFYSVDNIGNIEPTTTQNVTLDNTPPTTTPTIGEPKYVDPMNNIYATSDTIFTLTATDAGSGVQSTSYKITNSTGYDSGWLTYTEPFILTSLWEGNYTVAFNSTDNVGKVENTNYLNVTLVGPDINGDGKVDMRDLFVAINAFHSFPGYPRWNPMADMNFDGMINMKDIMYIASMFGKRWT